MLAPPSSPARDGRSSNGCKVGRVVLPLLDDANREWLARVTPRDSGWSDQAIADHLMAALASIDHDLYLSREVVRGHRNGCSCRNAGLVP